MESTVTTKNMTSIPISISRATGIRPGWKLDWSVGERNDELLVRVIPDRAERARRLFGQGQGRANGSDAIPGLIRDRVEEERR
jgi:bifunctional DNA-binding transcriptional regulator/antitoxin component of YhaV-PrlF toxin-antitoxin module